MEGLVTQIWVATHYLRTPDLADGFEVWEVCSTLCMKHW